MNKQIQHNIILFLLGKLSASLGSSIYGFAVGLYILKLTGSGLNFAITLLLTALPRIILAPIAGSLSDRLDRKKLIIISDFACSIWLLIIFIIFTNFNDSIVVLYIATFILNALNTFYGTAVSSALYNMVGPDNLQKAMSLNQMIISSSAILGPILGGIMFGVVNISTFMIINVITFSLSALASLFINYNLFKEKKESTEEDEEMLAQIKSGIEYVRTNTFLKNLIFVAFFLNFWFTVFPVAMPYLVLQVRGMESIQLGFIEGSVSVGMLIISIIFSQRPEIRQKAKAIIFGLSGMAVIFILVGAPSAPVLNEYSNTIYFPYLMLLSFLLATCIMFINMPINILLQKTTPDEFRGRVMALLEMGASSLTPIGFILFGFLLDFIPVWILTSVCGISIFILILQTLRKKELLQSMETLEEGAARSL